MIQFGRELQALSEQLCRQYGKNATHKKMLQVGGTEGKRRIRLKTEMNSWKFELMTGLDTDVFACGVHLKNSGANREH